MLRQSIGIISTLVLTASLPLLNASAQDAPAAKDSATKPADETAKPDASTPVLSPAETAPDPAKPVLKESLPPAPPLYAPAPPGPVPMTISPAPPMAPGFRANDVVISKDGSTAQLVGQISDGIANRLNGELLKNRGVKTLVLTSEGGLLIEGVALAHIVRKHKLNTHVEFLCGSACTFPLLAGKERSLAPGAIVGFHQASTMLAPLMGNTEGGDDPGNSLIRNTYANAQVGSAIIDGAMATPPADMWFPDAATLTANGVITRSAKAGEFSMAIGDWKSATEYRSALDADPLWAAAKASRPADYAFAAGSGWILAGRQTDRAAGLRSARSALFRRVLSGSPAYPDALLEEFLRTEQMIWATNDNAINRDCDFGSSIRFPASSPEKKEDRSAQLAVFQKMMAIPATRTQADSSTRANARAAVMAFWGRMVAEQSFNSYNVASNFCREPLSYFEELAKLPAAERMATLRSLILVQAIGMR
jgi:hypothetical protein